MSRRIRSKRISRKRRSVSKKLSKSRRFSRRQKSKKSKHKKRRKSASKKKAKRFGRMVGLSHIMGNNGPSDMSIFQQSTGLPPNQMRQHLENIPMSIRSNFYTNLGKFGSKRKSRSRRLTRRRYPRRFGSGTSTDLLQMEGPSSFGLNRRRTKRRRRSLTKRRRFGRMVGLSHIMGNSYPSDMSIFQESTGLPPNQMSQHLGNIPMSLRSNFYTNLN